MSVGRKIWLGLIVLFVTGTAASAPATAQQKPNILVIMGDDIGYWNISAYNRGMMGYRTPNIDRIANEGAHLHRLLRPAIVHRRPGGVYLPASADCVPGF